jgi:hypothetical protein
VVTALDKVQKEILTMQRLRAHANPVCLQAVLTAGGADDLFLGAQARCPLPLRARHCAPCACRHFSCRPLRSRVLYSQSCRTRTSAR